MALNYTDGDWTVARPNGRKNRVYPFSGDTKSFYYEQQFSQIATYWRPLALGSKLIEPDGNPVYLVEETPTIDVGGGIVRWIRRYATIPQSRVEWQQFAWERPGIETDSLYPQASISGYSNSGGNTTITAGSDPSISVGDTCVIRYTVTMSGGNQVGGQVFRTALSGTSGTTIVVSLISDPRAITGLQMNSIQKKPQGRDPKSISVQTKVTFDYFMPGVTAGISSPEDIPEFTTPLIVDADGKETLSYSSTTTPTISDYNVLIAAGTMIIAENSVVRRWMGSIYERQTRYVRAQ